MAVTPQGVRPILIAGGGIGGQAAAIALANRGFRCRVLEKRTVFDEAGAGIQIGPNGVAVLRALGVEAALAAHVGTPEVLVVRDGKHGTIQARLPLGAEIERRLGAPYWTAHRADLHATLRDAAARHPGIVMTPGFAADRLEATGDGVKVVATSGAEATGAAVIGADGLWSTLRGYVTGRIQPHYTGRRAYRTVIPAAEASGPLAENAVGLWLLPRCHVVHYPVRMGAEVAVVVVVEETEPFAQPATEVDRHELMGRLGGWLDPVRAEALSRAQRWYGWDLFELLELPAWTNGRVVLIGDAAHPMQPFLAQGAVMALEDSLTLADHMAATPADLPEAFVRFEAARRSRVERVARTAARNGRIYHLAGVGRFARNCALHAVSGQALLARYDWLYEYDALTVPI